MLVQVSVRIDGREPFVVERSLSGSAEQVEEQVREVLQRTGRVMLEPAFQQIADRTAAPCCCGRSMTNCNRRSVGLMTTCGEVIIQRRRYRCRSCGHELHPADSRVPRIVSCSLRLISPIDNLAITTSPFTATSNTEHADSCNVVWIEAEL